MDENNNYNEINENAASENEEVLESSAEETTPAAEEAAVPPVEEQPAQPAAEPSAPQGQSNGVLDNGRFVYYPDGTRRFVPYTQTAEQPPKKKKSKAGLIAGIVLVSMAFLLVLGVFGVLGAVKLLEIAMPDEGSAIDSSNAPVLNSSSAAEEDDNLVYIPDDASVPDIIQVAPVPDESFDSLVALYNKCADSCVTILCDVVIQSGYYTQEGQSLGSGFIIEGEKDGEKGFYIVTNHHVIEDAKTIRVKYNDDEIYDATLLGSDELSDIAVLKTERTDVTPIQMGDSGELAVGQWVVAIGTPSDEELQNTMSYGIVSGLDRKLQITNELNTVVKTMRVIQTTATLNPGNSGGPLINMAGQVVGINAMKLMEDFEGIGFALPSTEASYIINSLIEYGKVIDGTGGFASGAAQLGITGATVTDEVRKSYSLGDDCPDGVLVVNVNRGTSVYEAGLSIFDIITEFNGEKVETIEELKDLIDEAGAGKQVSLTFYRIGRLGEDSGYHTISFKLDTAK